MNIEDIFFSPSWTLFCVVCFRIFSRYVPRWFFEGPKKTAFQIWRVKDQHNSILIFIMTDNIWAVQNEKYKYSSKFKYTSVQVGFEFYGCDCAHTWIQIWWSCNMFYVMPDFKFWKYPFQLYCGIWIWKIFLKLEISDKEVAENKTPQRVTFRINQNKD